MGAVARRRAVSPSPRHTTAHRGSLDQTRAGRSRRSPRIAGARAMIGLLDRLARPLLYALDPEDAHRLAIRMLQIAPLPPAGLDDSQLATRVFGLNFPNPIGIAGINVGANKDAPNRVDDYVRLIERFAAVASYVTVNISSPNTPGLRDMQQAGVLDDLLARVIDARERVTKNAGPTPVLLKIAPDLP